MVLVGQRSMMVLLIALNLGVISGPRTVAASNLPEVAAGSAIVVDATTGQILYEKNADTPLPPASLTKLFTAFAALEVASLDQRMTVSQGDLVGEASMGLVAGEVLPFEALLYGMLLPSGNDAASTVARNLSGQGGNLPGGSSDAFMAYLNGRIAEIGLTSTHLRNPHGLDQDGHVSSARDIAAVTIYAVGTQPHFGRAIGAASYSGYGHQITQTNELHATYPGLIGGKTGITEDAGFCLMEFAERDGRRVVTVLLGSTPEAWYDDARALLDYGFTALASPGSPVFGQISFQPSAVSTDVDKTSAFGVTYASESTAVVQSGAVAARSSGLPWHLGLSIIVVVPCLAVVGVQTRRLLMVSKTHRARQAVHREIEQSSWNTQPFGTVVRDLPVRAWGEYPDVSRTRDRERFQPTPAPAFGD